MADEMKLPTEDEIRQLPRWARVAFAARCARGALQLLSRSWPDATAPRGRIGDHLRAVERAVAAAEQSAAAARAVADAYIAGAVSLAAADTPTEVVAVARAAAAAADATRAADTAYAAHTAALAAAEVKSPVTIARDFQIIRARAGGWTDDTPVPPDVFGPIARGADEESALRNRLAAADRVIEEARAARRAAAKRAVEDAILRDRLATIDRACDLDEFMSRVDQAVRTRVAGP